MRQNMSGWSQAECDELKKAGIADEILLSSCAGKRRKVYSPCVYCTVRFAGAAETKLGKIE